MKKLLLTSAGFTNTKVGDVFVSMLNKPVTETKILFIPTASRTEGEMKYVQESEDELVTVGILKNNIVWLDIDDVSTVEPFDQYDVIYVCGGNTFYLSKKLAETGMDKKIIEMVNNGVVYVGASAGSVIAGPNISISLSGDANDVALENMKGLELTDKVIFPHFQHEEQGIVDDFKNKLPYEIIPLTDMQAILEIDGRSSLIE